MAPTRRTAEQTRWRLALAAVVLLGGAMLVLASFQVWLSVATDTGGVTQISGWGSIGGDNELAGSNLNDLTGGEGSFRPAVTVLVGAGLAVVLAVALAVPTRSEHPYRIPAAVLVLVGLLTMGYGLLRLFSPDPLAVLADGEAMAGPGQYLTLGAGILLIAPAVAVLIGVVDPLERPPHRGIQR
ncbi:hypothetical protein GIS00_25610 [Nakamurella sp. YIM 132087]|uniref:Uncharacterized protein n=1 Tax=Nakamurella alba TaxID=2665158 RepID=A0A7K1FVS1_9ACTN|nr:hypothetical protein [Nakamurella alba]MTD17313.1 hypothetical protein [Nakamurella alba]